MLGDQDPIGTRQRVRAGPVEDELDDDSRSATIPAVEEL
jgi:hypothetical protein